MKIDSAKSRIIFRPKNFRFRDKRQKQKVEAGVCAKHGCGSDALTCGRCHKWWKLDTLERKTSYRSDDPKCLSCNHRTIIHNFYCKEHHSLCPECELDHPRIPLHLGCPYRDLREGKPLRREHGEWLRKRIGDASLKDLLLTLFPTGRKTHKRPVTDSEEKRLIRQLHKVRDLRERGSLKRHNKEFWKLLGVSGKRVSESRDWQLLQALIKSQAQSYDAWETSSGPRPQHLKHSDSSATKAGLERARAAGKTLGRPRKKPN